MLTFPWWFSARTLSSWKGFVHQRLGVPNFLVVQIGDYVLEQSVIYSLEKQGRAVDDFWGVTLGDMRHLKHLELDPAAGGLKVQSIAPLRCMRRLMSMSLPGQSIETIYRLSEMPSLHEADFRDNRIKYLGGLLRYGLPPNLRKLDLRGNPLNEEGCGKHVPFIRKFVTEVLSDCDGDDEEGGVPRRHSQRWSCTRWSVW